MHEPLPLRCACGEVAGELTSSVGHRLVCHCDDCQAYARFLGRDDVLDAHGGTDVFQTTPSRVRITSGLDALRVVRLSPKGLLRCYAGCCRTPVANMLAGPRTPFVGIVHRFVEAEHRDERLGPPLAHIQGRFAPGGCPPHAHPSAGAATIGRSAWALLVGYVQRAHRPSPFFDDAGELRVAAQVLSLDERRALYPA